MNTAAPQLIQALRKKGVLPVFKSNDLYLWQNIIDICYSCGLSVIEFRDSRESRGLKLFPFLIDYSSRYSKFQIGVSTIKPLPACEQYLQYGAAFINTPFLHSSLGKLCFRFDRAWIPGCIKVEEINEARHIGTNLVSVLPGSLTYDNFNLLSGAFPDLNFIPSSGNDLNDEAAARWLGAGALCIRREEVIFPSALTAIRDWQGIERLILKEIRLAKEATREHVNVSIL